MRPQRLYKTNEGRYYFLIDGLRKYIKIPKNITEAELVKLNMKTVLKLFGQKIRRKRKRKAIPKLEKPIVNGAFGKSIAIDSVWNQPTASSNFVQQEKPIAQISELITQAKRRDEASKGFESLITRAGKNLNDLFSGQQIVSNTTTIAKPKQADRTEDNVEFSSADKPTPETPYKDFIITAMSDVSEMDMIWQTARTESVDVVGYKAYLKKVIDSFELDEDETKKLYNLYKNNRQLQDLYERTQEKWITSTTGNTSAESSRMELGDLSNGAEESKTNPSEVRLPLRDETRPEPPAKPTPPPERPTYSKPSRAAYQEYLKKGASGLMPSLQTKPKTTEQKINETPSFTPSTAGTTEPASPMPVSLAEQVRKEMGFGYDGSDGLYNDEIAKIIRKRVGRTIPVIPSDRVNTLLDYVVKGDKKFAAVINTNPSTSDGSGNDGYRPGHWRAIFISNEDDFPSVEYFDPLAEGKPEKSLVMVMKKLCKKMNPEHLCLYKQNMIRRQAKEKSTCGWHSLQFIDDRWNGVPWSEATGYDDFMSKLQQPVDGSHDGEKEVNKYIKKYNVYL
jgi:hypothetical protein